MTDRQLTTPQRRVLDAVIAAGKPVARHEITVASKSYTISVLREFVEAGLIHVAAWRKTAGSNNGFTPLYLPGNQPSATKPKLDRAELLRRKRERQRQKKARERAGQGGNGSNSLPSPPALPSHHPTFGFWGV